MQLQDKTYVFVDVVPIKKTEVCMQIKKHQAQQEDTTLPRVVTN